MSDSSPGGFHICRPAPLVVRGSPLGLTLMSDLHIGAANVNYRLITRELEEAKANGDRVLVNGDVFDLITVKDKRFVPDVIHRRLRGKRDLINGALEWALEIFSPYADMIDMIGVGNHDVASERWSNIDLVKMLVMSLQKEVKGDHVIHYGGYTGFMDYRVRPDREPPEGRLAADHGRRLVIYYHHGSGGNAPVTKGMIDFARKSWVMADIIWMGHKHNRVASTIQTLSCPLAGDDPTIKEQRHIMTGAYFDTYSGQTQESVMKHGRRSNYAADMGLSPQGQGGCRVVLTYSMKRTKLDIKVIH